MALRSAQGFLAVVKNVTGLFNSTYLQNTFLVLAAPDVEPPFLS